MIPIPHREEMEQMMLADKIEVLAAEHGAAVVFKRSDGSLLFFTEEEWEEWRKTIIPKTELIWEQQNQ